MTWLATALLDTADAPFPDSIDTFRSHLNPAWIEAALVATGTASMRRRRLPAEQVIWLVLGMALMRNRPITEVVTKLELVLPNAKGDTGIAPSAIVQARTRVGSEPLEWLFRHTARQWSLASARNHAWRDLALFALDGTTLRVADSDENRAHFGVPNGGEGNDGGYPVTRLAALMAVRSRLLVGAEFGAYLDGEATLATPLWSEIPDDSLTIVDKGFFGAKTFFAIERGGSNRHWLVRAKQGCVWEERQSFAPHDKLVTCNVSSAARAKDSTLPKTFTARAIQYQHPDSKGPQTLLTSLLDPERFPAEEIVALYHERWEIEIGYDELKTHMLEREDTLRSRTVNGLRQELWGILLAYNLVRLEIERIAVEAGVAPTRISFVVALRLIRDEWLWCAVASPGSIPAKLRAMRQNVLRHALLPPRRSDRNYPRAVKVATSKYPKKHRNQGPSGLN